MVLCYQHPPRFRAAPPVLYSVSPMPSPLISSVHVLGDHSAHLKNPEYNATQLPLTPMHAAQKTVQRGIENIRRGLRAVRQTAERLLGHQPWDLLVRYIVAQITQSPWLPDGAIPALAGP